MACFIVTTAEAIIVTAAAQAIAHRERKALSVPSVNGSASTKEDTNLTIKFSKKLMWLANLLWGGSILLAFEHIWHGEIVPYFPFLTAAADPTSKAEMLKEMATVGVTMAAIVSLVWVSMLVAVKIIQSRSKREAVSA